MKSVKISIVIPVYNSEDHLDKCISSILMQDMHSFEVILVDDGSTDASPLICERYSSTDPRFKLIPNPHGGVSSARNAGLNVADGEYVMFVDSDDALAPGALSALYSAASDMPDLVVGGFNIYNEDIFFGTTKPAVSASYSSDRMEAFFNDTMMRMGDLYRGPWAKLYRNSVIRRNALRFNENLCYAEDKLFIYEFLCHATSAAAVNMPVYEYFRRAGTLSGGKTTERRASQLLAVAPLLSAALMRLEDKYPDNKALQRVYHYDLVCCDLMRVLRYFMKFRTPLLSEENILAAYQVMSYDRMLRLTERKVPGQIFNTLLYKMGSVRLAMTVFKVSSFILSPFHA